MRGKVQGRKAKPLNKAELLLPKEPLWYPPDYRVTRSFLVAAASSVERARLVRNLRHLPHSLESLDRLTYAVSTLEEILEQAIAEVKEAAPQQYLRFSDDNA